MDEGASLGECRTTPGLPPKSAPAQNSGSLQCGQAWEHAGVLTRAATPGGGSRRGSRALEGVGAQLYDYTCSANARSIKRGVGFEEPEKKRMPCLFELHAGAPVSW